MPLLTDEQIAKGLELLDGWVSDGKEIVKSYKTNNYVNTIGFVNKIALLAERADHHPDMVVKYGEVKVSLSTHSEGGITEKDIKLATEIEGVK